MEERISDLRERGVGAAHAVAQSYVCVCFSYVAYPLPVSPEFLFHFLVATVSFLEVSIDVSSHVTVALVTGLAAFFSLLTPPLSCSCSLSSSLSSRFLPFRIFRLWKQTLWNSFQQLFSSLSFEYCLFGDDSSQVFILLFLRRPLFFYVILIGIAMQESNIHVKSAPGSATEFCVACCGFLERIPASCWVCTKWDPNTKNKTNIERNLLTVPNYHILFCPLPFIKRFQGYTNYGRLFQYSKLFSN